jgi:solute carrier family 25 folate transporter 32
MSQTAATSHAKSIPGGDGRAPWHYKSTWDAARKMYAHEGIASFYSGLTPALLGLTHVAVQFPLYEYLKFQFTGLEMGQELRPDDGGGSHWLGMCVATMLSKVCASMATYPHEVIRTRLQTQKQVRPVAAPSAATTSQLPYAGRSGHGYGRPLGPAAQSSASSSPLTAPPGSNEAISASRLASAPPAPASPSAPRYRGIMHTVRTILHEEGWRAFYVGMGTNLIRAVPAAATTILTYEYVVGSIKKFQSEANRKLGALTAE